MAISLTIPQTPNYPPSMNYDLLRREGLRQLERLGSALWTDFNSHDPGVTMLEVLCYALTDLGYRSQLPTADLVTPTDQRKAFFTAAQILPNSPVTAHDFRKVLIDIEGVKNAWIEGCAKPNVLYQWQLDREIKIELPDFGYKNLKRMVFEAPPSFSLKKVEWELEDPTSEPPQKKKYTIETYLQAVHLLKKDAKKTSMRRLYEAIADFINNDVLKDDNLKHQWLLHYAERQLAEVQHWVSGEGITNDRLEILKQMSGLRRRLFEIKDNSNLSKARLNKAWESIEDELPRLLSEVKKDRALCHYFFVTPLWSQVAQGLMVKAADTPMPYSLFSPKGIYKVYLLLEEGYDLEKDKIKAKAAKILHKNRALSEDFGSITIIDKAPVCVHTQLELSSAADPVQVYAALIFAIENFLSPPVRMYSLSEMMDRHAVFSLTDASFEQWTQAELPPEILQKLQPLKGLSWTGRTAWQKALHQAVGQEVVATYEELLYQHTHRIYESHEVFQGPLLRHGFIDDAELAAANWRRVVYKSDLFQVLSKVPQIARILSLHLHKAPQDDQNPATIEKEWCLSFDCDCQPTLDLDCSEVVFIQNGRPMRLDEMARVEVMDTLEQLRAQHAKIDRLGTLDLPIPQGVLRPDLAEYTSIQEEFPRTYHVGREGIASHHSPARKAQVKQLKGFLMFFDQLLANYLTHLSEVRNMLSVEMRASQWHLYQALYDVPFVPPLLTAFDASIGTWEDFKNNPDNGYITALKNLTNGSELTQRLRQNQIIDHLLARFGEQFTDQALQLFQIEQPVDETTETLENIDDWLIDKQRILKNIPRLGRLRGRGFNYHPDPQDDYRHFWDSDNEAGVKSRVLAQLGIAHWTRRTVSCSPQFFTDTKLETVGKTKRYRFGIKKDENSPHFWMLSTALYSQEEAANRAADDFYAQAANLSQYKILPHEQQYFVGFWPASVPTTLDNALLLSPARELQEAEVLLREIQQYIYRQCQRPSFHIVEHILLRPADEHYALLQLPPHLHDAVLLPDPYSFWVSVVVPDWVELFDNSRFEELVRCEMPAHIAIRFCYLTQAQMLGFEEAYFEWLKHKTDPDTEAFDLRQATNSLIEILNKTWQSK